MVLFWRLCALLLLTLAAPCFAIDFSSQAIMQWQAKQFVGQTDYQLVYDSLLNKMVIRAESNAAASGLFYETDIDLTQTPWLRWRWRVERFPEVDNEKNKQGDDFAARVYIVVRSGWSFFSTRAVSYVWSQHSLENAAWPNPFAGKKAMMLAVQSGSETSHWVEEKRNLREDLKRLFGKDITRVNAIAIMTDADNSQSSAVSFYDDIKVTAD